MTLAPTRSYYCGFHAIASAPRVRTRRTELIGAILICLTLSAAETVDIGVVTEDAGIGIVKCHAEDHALVEIVPLDPAPHRVGGFFTTTNRLLVMSDLTMTPTGTNLAKIQMVCSGSTSPVKTVQFTIRRPIPPPRVKRAHKIVDDGITPPVPGGMAIPLPGGVSEDYSERRQKR